MPLLISTMAVLFLMALAAVFIVLRKIQNGDSIPTGAVQERSAVDYHPMFRLLDESDFQCMIPAKYPGRAQLLRCFRAERRSLFRVYLRELGADHARIVVAIRQLLIESQIDRPDLAVAMYRCQFTFASAMASIELKLLLHATGIGTVDARALVAAMEGLQQQLQDMVFVRVVGYGQ
jgi:hypothetical protein